MNTLDMEAMERIRAELSEHADRLDQAERDMRDTIVATRRKVREAIQYYDRLAIENTKLDACVVEQAKVIQARDAEIIELKHKLARLELAVDGCHAERLVLAKPKSGT